jgi:hypothetical protein
LPSCVTVSGSSTIGSPITAESIENSRTPVRYTQAGSQLGPGDEVDAEG